MTTSARRTLVVHLGGSCALACAPCDCQASPASDAELTRRLTGGGARLELRGNPDPARLEAVLSRARALGFGQIVVRANALGPSAPARLAAQGVDSVLVPIFSHVPLVHDRVAGVPRALPQAIEGMRAAAEAGLGVELEVPLLPRRLSHLRAIVERAHDLVHGRLRRVRFYLPGHPLPAAIAPSPWSERARDLAEALATCRQLGVAAPLVAETDAIPLCALSEFPEAHVGFHFPTRATTAPGCVHGSACAACAVAVHCVGVAESYRAAHGDADIVAYPKRPSTLGPRRNHSLRVWTDRERASAKNVHLLVLRPTIHCNQDCQFCSANETTPNVWPNPGQMMRAIARAARRGVRRVSFSGGEPTLSKHLVDYVRVAHRCGIHNIEIVTNGVLLDAPAKVDALRRAGLNHAFVSLHAHDEMLSRAMTQKIGDFDRTVRAVDLLLAAGVQTVLNHVINARNYRQLSAFVDFVHERWARPWPSVQISFAFITPQFKALENPEWLPPLTEVRPYLHRAMRRALELGQSFRVGSRQGIPPCLLGEFEAWSDLLELAHEAASEDAPQKQRAAGCDTCRYTRYCTGLWKPYVARYGLDEIHPLVGPAIGPAERVALLARPLPEPWRVPTRFEDVPELLRHRHAEEQPPLPVDAPAATIGDDAAPVVLTRTRPLRVLLVGSGPRARALARALPRVAGLSLAAVASPHLSESDTRAFGGCPTYHDAAAALADMCPDAVIVASATDNHFQAAQQALRAGVAVLVERPFTRTLAEAADLVALADTHAAPVVVAHEELFAPGLELAFAAGPHRSLSRHAALAQAPQVWSRSALAHSLYPSVALLVHGLAEPTPSLTMLQMHGEARLERLRVAWRFHHSNVELVWDATSASDETMLTVTDDVRRSVWRSSEGVVTLNTGQGDTPQRLGDGNLKRMLAEFCQVAQGRARPVASAHEGLAAVAVTDWLLQQMAEHGAPFERPGAPRHVASRQRA